MRRAIASWWLRNVMRDFCFVCDRTTFRHHQHTDDQVQRAFRRELRRASSPGRR